MLGSSKGVIRSLPNDLHQGEPGEGEAIFYHIGGSGGIQTTRTLGRAVSQDYSQWPMADELEAQSDLIWDKRSRKGLDGLQSY